MTLTVLKFGGTSVGSAERIRAVAHAVAARRARGEELAVVVSAMGDTTDRLLALAAAVAPGARSPGRELDVLLATGEQHAAALLALALEERGVRAVSLTGAQAELWTDGRHGDARIRLIRTRRVRRVLAEGCVPVITGFQGVSASREITTLGRGGSDTTAVALAIALGAERCDIYTDVDGVYSADPRLVADARCHARLTHQEALMLALSGACVLHARAAALALTHHLPLRILSSLRLGADDGPAPAGTLIDGAAAVETPHILGVAAVRDAARLVLDGVPAGPAMTAAVLGALDAAHVVLDRLDESRTSDGACRLTVLLRADRAADAECAVRDVVESAHVRLECPVARITIVGTGVSALGGIVAAALQRLARAGIEAEAMSITELGLVLHVAPERADETVRLLHDALLGARAQRRVRHAAPRSPELATALATARAGSAT